MAGAKRLRCSVFDVLDKVPTNAQFVSLKFPREPAIDINGPKDVLEQVCRNVLEHRNTSARLREVVRRLNPGWLNTNTSRMGRRRARFYEYFVDLGGEGRDSLARAVRVLEWCGCSESHALITYELPTGGSEQGKGFVGNGFAQGVKARPSGATSARHASLRQVKKAILDDYPNGIVLNNASLSLLEKSLGLAINSAVVDSIRERMFVREDGVMLYPEMLMAPDAFKSVLLWAENLLASQGMFALSYIRETIGDALHNISSEGDFKQFFIRYFSKKLGMKVRGSEGWRMCFSNDHSDDESWEEIGVRIRGVLAESGDAVSVDDLVEKLPYLNRTVIERAGRDRIGDAITFDMDGVRYLKLLETYYLPDDFEEVLADIVAEIEEQSGVASIKQLEDRLDSAYGDGFRANFCLDDESAFKQVIAKVYGNPSYEWKRDVYVANRVRASSNVVEQFLLNHKGKFHEEDFFRFAEQSRGFKNHGMLILTFLRKHCTRLSKEWWIGDDIFDQKCAWSDSDRDLISQMLNNALGSNVFQSIISLPASFYDALPTLQMDGESLSWNSYLLTSLAVKKLRNVCVINDEPSPYTVTAIIIPRDAPLVGDVVEYILKSYPKRYFAGPENAFEFLKANNIRLSRTAKLMAKITECLED